MGFRTVTLPPRLRTFAAAAWVCCAPGALGQLSPGPLSRAHKALEGPTQCAKCHAFGVETPQFKCVDCHREIRVRLEESRGYHARVANLAKQGRDCVGCHLEHYGRDFKLVYFENDRRNFDHRKTGYPLKGKHASLACKKCHNAEHIPPEELATFQVKDPERTLLGLPTGCTSCHTDEHRGQLGEDCGRCHGFSSWKETPGFRHSETRFPLTGRHADVDCAKCHPRGGGAANVVRYTGLRSDSCRACHRDPHGGAFTAACETCHVTEGWKNVRISGAFDHRKTDFPLAGKHAALACTKCHAQAAFSRPVAHQRCDDCHQDVHGGQFRDRAAGSDCAACHNENAFVPALFDVKSHQETAYPLEGKHVTVACRKCHKPAGARTRYRIPHEGCQSCHQDPHESEFAPGLRFQACSECHTVDGFRPSTLTLARHDKTRFPLRGAHVAVACSECHRDLRGAASKRIRFSRPDVSCLGCHQDPHGGQFSASPVAGRFQCTTCHNEESWARLNDFDHAATRFRLHGAHGEVACLRCHRPATENGGIRSVVFRDAPTKCAGCHEDPHAGQFDRGQHAQPCTACHTNRDWKPTRFDHNDYSTFSLKGAHRSVACRQCHFKRERRGGLSVVIYRGTPRTCAACHAPARARRAPRPRPRFGDSTQQGGKFYTAGFSGVVGLPRSGG